MMVQAFYLDLEGGKLTPLDSFAVTGHEFVLTAKASPPKLDKFFVTDMNGFIYLCKGTSLNGNMGGNNSLLRIEGLMMGKSQLPQKDQNTNESG